MRCSRRWPSKSGTPRCCVAQLSQKAMSPTFQCRRRCRQSACRRPVVWFEKRLPRNHSPATTRPRRSTNWRLGATLAWQPVRTCRSRLAASFERRTQFGKHLLARNGMSAAGTHIGDSPGDFGFPSRVQRHRRHDIGVIIRSANSARFSAKSFRASMVSDSRMGDMACSDCKLDQN